MSGLYAQLCHTQNAQGNGIGFALVRQAERDINTIGMYAAPQTGEWP